MEVIIWFLAMFDKQSRFSAYRAAFQNLEQPGHPNPATILVA
jgi:hypothetical protein